MGKKIIEVSIQKNKLMLNCEDLKRIYYRNKRKNPIVPKYSETNDYPEAKHSSPTDTDLGLEDC